MLETQWILEAAPGVHPPGYVRDPEIELRFQDMVARRHVLLQKKIGTFTATPHPYPVVPPTPLPNANKAVWHDHERAIKYSDDFWKAHATLTNLMLASLGPMLTRQLTQPLSGTSTLSAQDIYLWVKSRYGELKITEIIAVEQLMKKPFSTIENFANDLSEFNHCITALIRSNSAVSAIQLKIILLGKTGGNKDLKNLVIRAYEQSHHDIGAVLAFLNLHSYSAFDENLIQANAVAVPKPGKVNSRKRKNQETSGAPPRARAFCYYHSFDRPNNSHLTKDCRDMKKHASSFTDKQRNAVSYADCAYEVVKIGN
jgi:hypothetical protein